MNDFELNKEPKIESGFKIPDHYFDTFSDKVIQQLPENTQKVIPIFSKTRIWTIAIAAVFVISLSIPIFNAFKTSETELDKETLENYLSSHAEISNDDIVELLDEEDIQKMKLDYSIEDKTIEDILSTNSDLEEYIIN
jgi:uncharacterized radical SAM superfamily protein